VTEIPDLQNDQQEQAHPVISHILGDTNHDWEVPLLPPERLEHWKTVCKQVFWRNRAVGCHILVSAQRSWRVQSMRGLAIQLLMLMEACGFGRAIDIGKEVGIDPKEAERASRLITNVQNANTQGGLTAPGGSAAGIKPSGRGPKR